MTPSICRLVCVLVDPKDNNGSDVAPAVITRVWSESPPGQWVVNYRVLLDGPDTPWMTSAYLYADEETARAKHPEGSTGMAAFWPPRV